MLEKKQNISGASKQIKLRYIPSPTRLIHNVSPSASTPRPSRGLPPTGDEMPSTRVWVKQGLNSHRSAQVLLVPLGNISPDVYAKYCEILRRFRCVFMFALQQEVSVPSETIYGEVRCQCCACRGASFGLRVCVDGSLLLLHAARLLSIRKSNTHLESQHGTVQVRGEPVSCSLST